MKKNVVSKLSGIILICILLSLGCNLPIMQSENPVSSANTPETQTEPDLKPTEIDTPAVKPIEMTAEEVYSNVFASYPAQTAKLPQAYSEGYILPLDLNDVTIPEGLVLSPEQQQYLSENGFVVEIPVAGKYNEFYQIYENIRYHDDQPAFITTDSVFHIYHLIFDKMLRDLERDYFIENIESMTGALLKTSLEQYQATLGTPLEQPALRNVAFFSVAAQLLELPDPVPDEVANLVDDELELINAHSGPDISPIWYRPELPDDELYMEDYSQYVPRGHYTRSEELKKYFRVMMWYGRMTFRLMDDYETQRALLITHALRHTITDSGRPALELWQNVYEPTVFIVGKTDDLSIQEYGAISDRVFGENPDILAYANDELFATFKETSKELPAPQVNSMWVWIWQDKEDVTKGFRVMGQRFTLDSYVFGQVIWRNVGTETEPRGLPKGLDLFAALGSDEAYNILDEMEETNYVNYPQQMEKVKSEVSQLELDSWTQNLYWAWLYAFKPVIEPKDTRYPAFMQNQAWTRKDLHTALGSWTELKHDTILYAKQVMAEMGGGGPETPVHGYVEPNPEVYGRLLALTEMTYNGLDSRGLLLLNENTASMLENLNDLLTFLKSVSESELAGQPLTDDDYWRIIYYGGELEYFTLAAADTLDENGGHPVLEDQKAALVADVATGTLDGVSLVVLEEGIGQPTPIYVVLPDDPYRVAVGAVYSYYEFTVPPGERMTDETWQQMVEDGSTPPAPEWTSIFMAPAAE